MSVYKHERTVNMNYVEEFNKYVQFISDKYTELSKQLSKVDSEQDDILHFLELETYDAITMMKITKKLREVRERRREIKNELSIIQTIHCRIGKSNVSGKTPSVYTFKTDVLYNISNKKKIITKTDVENGG